MKENESLVMKGEESCTVKICAADFVKDCAVKPGFHLFQHKIKLTWKSKKLSYLKE